MMKKVTLKSITLRNFRGEKERTTNFNQNGETTIMGENGLGKSRHFDAFMWLLFGKDKFDRKDYNVRTIVDKEPIHRVECSVSATLDIDGQLLTVKRAFTEKWVKPRGQVDEVFKGNETETFWNDVPVSTTEYQRRINEIINDSVFKMVTNPYYFPQLKWQDQREQLFQLAGTITDNEIAAQNPEFSALLDKISGKGFADFKREISARKKRLKDDLAQIQPRIDQTQKLMPEAADFVDLEKQAAGVEKEIANIDKAISDKSEAIRQQYEATQKKQSEINDLKQKQQKILFDAQNKAREDAFKANANRREVENNIKVAETEIATLKRAISNNQRDKKDLEARINTRLESIEKLREQWHDENAREYRGDDICSTCGQPLPEEKRVKALQFFANTKACNLAAITENGKRMKEDAGLLNKEVDKLVERNNELQDKMKEQEETLATLKETLAQTSAQSEKEISPEELPEYKTLGDVIKGLESTLDAGTQPIDTTDLQNRKKGFQQMRDEIKAKLANRDLIAKYGKEIKDLEAQGKAIAQQIADVEREEYTIQQFTKARIDECERRINGLFKYVTFKLFDYTIEGNEYETCIPLVDGVPFDVANTAGQVNAGLDIINTLVRFHGVSAPIFVDNSESINKTIPVESQVIHLVVTKDKELVVR
ncbi:MAG: AAA family ATPase [Prevotella sp.]|jgi:DNA repair exonuclease SbcCD ATPase subunit|nr:AAA family ATPase [Prevotella sp.]